MYTHKKNQGVGHKFRAVLPLRKELLQDSYAAYPGVSVWRWFRR
jgi:hypothetical protein